MMYPVIHHMVMDPTWLWFETYVTILLFRYIIGITRGMPQILISKVLSQPNVNGEQDSDSSL